MDEKPKKPRKQRSDKGKKHNMAKKPRKKRTDKGKSHTQHLPDGLDNRRRNSRPKVYDKLDLKLMENLVKVGATKKEIEHVTGVSHETINKALREVYGVTWSEFFKKHCGDFKISLRRAQYRSAIGGEDENGKHHNPSVPMQIWLGKQFLGQTDKQEIEKTEVKNIPQFEWAEAEDVTDQKQLEEKDEDQEESGIQGDTSEQG